MKKYLLIIFLMASFQIAAVEKLNCLILLNKTDTESIGNSGSFYLMSKLQSAIAEKCCPIFIHASLWSSFVERRISFEQSAKQSDTRADKILKLHNKIKERIQKLSNNYNEASDDYVQNKALIIQRINEEFYNKPTNMSASNEESHLLLDYITSFNPEEWLVYKKEGFYLLVPKNYLGQHTSSGFKLNNLEEVKNPLDIVSNYLNSLNPYSIINALSDFFLTYEDSPDKNMPYAWNLVLSGHGYYKTILGEPTITDLTVAEFRELLEFFNTKLRTHLLHYSSCYAGGNNISLALVKHIIFLSSVNV